MSVDIQDLKDRTVALVAEKMACAGAKLLGENPQIYREASELTRYMLSIKPSGRDRGLDEELVALMGVSIGLILQKTNEQIEQLGGVDAAAKSMGLDSAEATLKHVESLEAL